VHVGQVNTKLLALQQVQGQNEIVKNPAKPLVTKVWKRTPEGRLPEAGTAHAVQVSPSTLRNRTATAIFTVVPQMTFVVVKGVPALTFTNEELEGSEEGLSVPTKIRIPCVGIVAAVPEARMTRICNLPLSRIVKVTVPKTVGQKLTRRGTEIVLTQAC